MLGCLRLWFGLLVRCFRSHRSLLVENVALRQQRIVLKRRHPKLNPPSNITISSSGGSLADSGPPGTASNQRVDSTRNNLSHKLWVVSLSSIFASPKRSGIPIRSSGSNGDLQVLLDA